MKKENLMVKYFILSKIYGDWILKGLYIKLKQ